MALNFIAHKYRILGKKGEGTFSEVLKCQNVKDGTYWACKKMKQTYESLEQVNTLREIQAMRRLSPHENILQLHEVLFDKRSGMLVLICELMDMNIYELIRGRRHYLDDNKVRMYMYDLCKSLDHMHRNGIFHRDVKPENILIRHDSVLKLADFGSCRSVYAKQPYTEYISTRWYRAPECLLTDGYYTYKMDIWSVGCVLYEVMSLRPLFPGSNEVDQIAKIHEIIGSPEPGVLTKLRNKTRGVNFNFPQKKGSGLEKILPHASPESIDLIYKMCTYDPDDRITAKQALRHPYFKVLRDEDKRDIAHAKAQKQRQQQLDQQQQQTPQPQQPANPDKSSAVIRPPPVLPLYHAMNQPESLQDEESKSDTKQNDPDKENVSVAANDQTDNTSEKGKTEKEQKNKREKDQDGNSREKEGQLGEPKRKKTPVLHVGRKSPSGVSGAKYPSSILQNTYQYQRRERDRDRRRRRRARMAESGPSPVGASFFPKVPVKPGTYQPTFHTNTYGARAHATLPKIQGIGATSGSTSSSYLPSLTQSFTKQSKPKNIHTTKTIYGNYQLPSIDRR